MVLILAVQATTATEAALPTAETRVETPPATVAARPEHPMATTGQERMSG
jgi:hypothetical protein